MKSLKAQGHSLADSHSQLDQLHTGDFALFKDKLENIGLYPLKPTELEIFQMNLGYMCNQTCKHCHVDAGPDRKEIMTLQTMKQCLNAIGNSSITTVDLTGGAPEMNPNFKWLVEELSAMNQHIIDRCNLTILLANKKYRKLPEFLAKHKVEVVSSLPHYTSRRTNSQRGDGVFEKSIEALQILNQLGYGKEGSDLQLNLVYNPTGAMLPGSQQDLERDYKKELKSKFDIEFNNLFVITNMPISRFLDYLLVSGNYHDYMQKLIDAFNPSAAAGVMCRNTLSVGWQGYLYDCDFNQMLGMKVQGDKKHISEFDLAQLSKREILIDQHCYGCTAGMGSSCGGQIG